MLCVSKCENDDDDDETVDSGKVPMRELDIDLVDWHHDD